MLIGLESLQVIFTGQVDIPDGVEALALTRIETTICAALADLVARSYATDRNDYAANRALVRSRIRRLSGHAECHYGWSLTITESKTSGIEATYTDEGQSWTAEVWTSWDSLNSTLRNGGYLPLL